MMRNATTSYWEKKNKKRVRILGKKYVSVFWALSGHRRYNYWQENMKNCLAQTSQATQLKVFLFRRSPFFVAIISYFFCQASMKYMYSQRGHNNSGYMRNEVTVTRQLTHNLIPHARVHYSQWCNRDQWVRSCRNALA